MRVCIFSTAYFPFVGGAEVAIREIARRLPDWEFDLFTARLDVSLPRFETIENVHVYRVGTGKASIDKKLLALHGAHYAAEYHRKNPYDLVWSMMASYGGFAALAFKKKFPGVPYLLTLQEGDSEEHIANRVVGFKWLFKQIFERADALQAISNYLLGWGERMGFKGAAKVVIPNGVDVEHFSAPVASAKKTALRERLGIGANDKVVITVSRLVAKNGVGNLIEAMTYAHGVHCVIVGTGELESELKDQVRALDLNKRVHFVGHIDHPELPLYLQSADVFCRPSLSEGLGIAFLEALAAGVPVVASNVGGIVDIVKDGQTGLLCDPARPEDIAHKINRFLEDKKLRDHCIDCGKKETQRGYDWTSIAERMKMLMESVAHKI